MSVYTDATMSEFMNRPPKGVALTYDMGHSRGVHKYFDDPDFILASIEADTPELLSVCWAAKEMGARATLYALKEMLTLAQYEDGKAYVVKANDCTGEALHFFAKEWKRGTRVEGVGGAVHLEGEPRRVVAEIFENEQEVYGFGLTNGEIEITWHTMWPKAFHDIPSKEIQLREQQPGALTRMVIDQCVSVTGREGLVSNIDRTLDEFGEHITRLK